MGLTDAPAAPTNESSAKKLEHSIVSHEANLLLLEGAQPAKKQGDKATAAAPAEAAVKAPVKPVTQADAPPVPGVAGVHPGDRQPAAPPERVGIRQADSPPDLRTNVLALDKSLTSRVQNNIDLASQGTFAITDILKSFDRIYDDATKYSMTAVQSDYNSLKPGDKSTAAVRDAENRLLHAPGIIQANKALVAYDTAMKASPEATQTQPISRADLIKEARTAMALASKDTAVAAGFQPKADEYEALIKKYSLDKPGTPGAPQAPVEAPPPVQPTDANKPPGDAPVNGFIAGHAYTDAELANLDKVAAAHAPARQALEAQLWGDPSKNAQIYLDTKANIYNIVNGMDSYTPAQRNEFQTKLVSTTISAADKQKYIDTFAANDKDLHANATMLLKNTGDKIGVAAQWYAEENYSFQACAAYYQTAEQADVKKDTAGSEKYWNAAQKYAFDSTFFSNQLQDAGVARIDAKMTGDYQSLFAQGRQAQQSGDTKNAQALYEDSIAAADRLYAKNKISATKNLDLARTKLNDGTILSSDDKLNIGVSAFGSARILTAPIEARSNAAAALSGLQQADDGTFQATKVGQAYQKDIAQWLHEATTMGKDVDVKGIKSVGDALASAAANNVQLHQPGKEQYLAKVAWESAVLLGGKLPDTKGADGKVTPGPQVPGAIDTPYSTAKTEAAYLITQGKGHDAIAALKEAGSREATAKGWDLKDAANNDGQLALLIQQAKPLDPDHYLDIMKRSDALWDTPAKAVTGLALFSLGAWAVTKGKPQLLEDALPAFAKEGMLGAATKGLVKFAPVIVGTGLATIGANTIDHFSATHDGFLASTAKGLSLVAVVKGGRYLSRVGATGFAPGVAENMFGAAEKGGELTTTKVLGRMVTDLSGRPLAEANVTAGQLVESMTQKGVNARNISALASLPAETPVFTKGVLNPTVDRAFLGTGQRELAETLQQTLPKAGKFLPTAAELSNAARRTTIDVTSGDANAISRELALRGTIANRLAGSARQATEQNVLTRLAAEVSHGDGGKITGSLTTEQLANSNLSKEQLLSYAKARAIPVKELGSIGNVIGEDAPILKAGNLQGDFKGASPELKAQLKEIAAKTPGAKGSLTTEQYLNYANENKLDTKQVEAMMNRDPMLIKNGRYNPDMLLKDPKTGAITRAIDTPNFKGPLGIDNMQSSQLLSHLAKKGVSERSVLIRLAQRANQDVELDAAKGMTKKDLVDTMTARGLSAETIAKDYPKLSKLSDTDLLVKGGKLQKSLVSRDIPETMTKKDFVAMMKATKNVDLADPAQLANSPWSKSLGRLSDDAYIIKDGKWQVSTTRAARASVSEKSVGLNLKDLGLKEQDGNFLMTATKANLNAGQLVNLMKDAKLDPAKIEALAKLSPDAPLVVDGQLVKAPSAELSATSKVFTAKGNVKDLQLKMNEGQLAVLSGDASDKEIVDKRWWQVSKGQVTKDVATIPFRGLGALGSSLKDGVVNLGNSGFGTGGLSGTLDPLTGTFRKTGASYAFQNFGYGTLGTLATTGLYEGIVSNTTQGYDPVTGEKISTWQDWNQKMWHVDGFQDGLQKFGWMPQMSGLLTDVAGNPFWTPVKQSFFIAGIGQVKDVAESYILGGPAATFKLKTEMEDVQKLNDAPLENHPEILNQPDPAQNVGPADTTQPPVTPAPETPPPAPAPPKSGLKQSVARPPVRQSQAAPEPGNRLVITPPQTVAPKKDDLDDALGGGKLQ